MYVRISVELEEYLARTLAYKDAKKKMSPTNARALNTMKLRIKKHNVLYAEQIAKYREVRVHLSACWPPRPTKAGQRTAELEKDWVSTS